MTGEMATSERVAGCGRIACRRQLKIDGNVRVRPRSGTRTRGLRGILFHGGCRVEADSRSGVATSLMFGIVEIEIEESREADTDAPRASSAVYSGSK